MIVVLVLISHMMRGLTVWLSLAEYSIRHNVSISTLRRKIKASEIPYRMDEGKYFIEDMETQPSSEHRPSLTSEANQQGFQSQVRSQSAFPENVQLAGNVSASIPSVGFNSVNNQIHNQPHGSTVQNQRTSQTVNSQGSSSTSMYSQAMTTPTMPNQSMASPHQQGESVITAANRLLSDLKKAYTQVLQDKENQITELREEIIDLKTLVKVLESENNRLRIENR